MQNLSRLALILACSLGLAPLAFAQGSTQTVATTSLSIRSDGYDLAREGSTGSSLVVWAEVSPGFVSGDLFAQRIAPDGSLMGPRISLEADPALVSFQPRVGADSASGHFVVAYIERDGGSSDTGRLLSVDAATGVVTPGGNFGESGGLKRCIDLSNASDSGSFLLSHDEISSTPGSDDHYLSAVQTAGGGAPQVVGAPSKHFWSVSDDVAADGAGFVSATSFLVPFTGDSGVVVRAHDALGEIVDALDLPTPSAELQIAGSEGRFVLVERSASASGAGTTLRVRPIRLDGGVLMPGFPIEILPATTESITTSDLEFNGESLTLSYGVGDQRYRVELDPATGVRAEAPVPVDAPQSVVPNAPLPLPRSSAIFAQAGSDSDVVFAAWVRELPTGEDRLVAGSSAPGGQTTRVPGGCGSGGVAFAGSAVIGNPDFGVSLAGSRPLGFSLLMYSVQRQETACGVCTVVPSVSQAVFPFQGITDPLGTLRFITPMPDNSAFIGRTLYAQWGQAGGTAACGTFSLDLSDAVQVTIE